MTKSLRKLAESRGRYFIIHRYKLDFDLGFEKALVAEHPHKDTPKDEHHIAVIEASHAKKLSDALLVAAEVIEMLERALQEECVCDSNEGVEYTCDGCIVRTKAKEMLEKT